MKSSAPNLRRFGCHSCVQVPEGTHQAHEPMAILGVLLYALLLGTFWEMLEKNRTVEISQCSEINEKTFPMEEWRNVNTASMDPWIELILVEEDDKVVQLFDGE